MLELPLASLDQRTLVTVLIPLAGITLAGVITVSAMYFHHRRRELWHATARIALEKGQPMPPFDDPDDDAGPCAQAKLREGNHDVRGGLVLIAVGAGLWLMFTGIAPNLRYIGAIPGLIGVALLLYALLAALFGRKNPPQDPTSRP